MMLAGLLLAAAALLLAGCSPVEAPQMMEARGDQCVEPVEVIRRDHMTILKAEKDRAVNLGVRNPDHSIRGCVNCHVSPTASRDDPATHFCLNCHTFTAVRMDCFQCHADKPANEDYRHALNPHGPAHGFQLADSKSLARDMEAILALEGQEQ
ncbi:hypothetical protein B1C78_14845 [Thioalkalivibrio denitrificans]|uniref:Uncharacterized protein n=1 Tax=Thioalkalivibrio denitrificans TaxID=108003 RepID=A0A1V3NCJ5_9GAMM|nr:hypothetical protein B1C78_14845 [Thioalkalivibrio denitrificans]